ncbi:MAG: hypothetical protein NZM00_05910 [Anaerolinea sp.]|nr:hypothetical protein [Anaerolinea sp.]
MADHQFAEIKRLIRDRRYDEARALLQNVDDSRARRWLARLEERERSDPVRSDGLTAALVVAALVLLLGGALALVRALGWG